MLKILYIVNILLFSVWLIIIRGTLPRYRIDQLQFNVWKDWIFIWLIFFGSNLFMWLSLMY
jgi:NADH:ubiquinone oxidoreductase subunit H